jgi:hypothetical protein
LPKKKRAKKEPNRYSWKHRSDMFLGVPKILLSLAVSAFALLGFWQAHAANIPSADEMPAHPFDDRFSTNWIAAVRAALPTSYSENGDLDFQAATNSLCQESIDRYQSYAGNNRHGFELDARFSGKGLRPGHVESRLSIRRRQICPQKLQ